MGRRIANPDVTIALIPRHLRLSIRITPCPPSLRYSSPYIGSPPFFHPVQSTSSWPGLMTETKKRVKEEKEHSKILPFSFTSLALCLASIFALTKRNRLCQRVAATTGV
ncbi:hypothetical protein ALC60_09324 [Trachymyrmex zeteki]|uniref:Uncharacterized protein n=1 Tax=Mycetomoellerius zeteki TaxID=64791 RepID=A0A151WUQ3_9HYME|nr:hypothetical protein ALC60_09324 [Trachymyrmex zeteki]